MAKKVQKSVTTIGEPLPIHPDLEMVQDRLGREATSSEEVEKVLAEIAAENAAKDAELDQHVKEAKAALRQSRGKTIDPARAQEIEEERAATTVGSPVVLDGNQKVVTDKKTAKALVKSEKSKAKKPVKPAKVEKPAEKTVEVSVVITNYSREQVLELVNALKAATGKQIDILLSVNGSWYPVQYGGGDTWQYLYQENDVTTTGPIGRMKLITSKSGEIDAWQKKLGHAKRDFSKNSK